MQKTGIILVIVGFAVFLVMPFMAKHVLSEQLVTKEFETQETSSIASHELHSSFGNPSTTWSLISKVDKAIIKVNEGIINRYALSNNDIKELKELAKSQKLDEQHLEVLWGADSFKAQSFISYGN